MELTKEQIQRVEKYLDVKKVYYIDVRVEVLDHIVSELENNICENTSFEEAFKNTTKKWNTILKDSSSVYIGYAFVKPKIVIDKMKKYGKPNIIKLLFAFLLMILLISLKLEVTTSYAQTINFFAKFFIYTVSFIIGLGYILIWQSKQKTSYRFLYKTQVLPYVLFPIMLFGDFLTKEGNLDLVKMTMLVFVAFIIQLGIKLYKNHFLAIKKYACKWN
ncbi:hypothetical protein [uncultured Tenacibaculum sp.]|uniref:hypothetical protein n=1 Tax=uncultured Tenacibaculum sp. TaxID=174713 RepID=UPI0026191EE1|nr:hypothetical protein [uncultured Tenacibaculum sp.]